MQISLADQLVNLAKKTTTHCNYQRQFLLNWITYNLDGTIKAYERGLQEVHCTRAR